MSTKPLVVVSGSTGAQGGSVVNSLHDTGRYRIRALTRNVNSEKAKALANKGIEVFKCDLSVRQDVENALKGADIAFIVTNFWDPSIIGKDPTEEERQGKMIADVAKATGLNWLIYSSLVDPAAESNGKYSRIVHFSGKNIVERHIRSLSLPCATFVYLGFYSGNFNTPFAKFDEKDGVVEVYVPYLTEDDVLPVADAAADTGPVVAKIIEEGPTSWNGRKVPIAAEFISLKNICESFTKATGKPHKVKTLTDKDLSNDPNSSDEIKEMFGWFKDYGYYGRNDKEANDLSITKKLHPTITTFQQYVDKTYGKK